MRSVLRPWLSEYWVRRVLRKDSLLIDVTAYDLGSAFVFKYSLSNGGTGQVVRDFYFVTSGYLTDGPPCQAQAGAAILTDIALLDPIRFNTLPLNRQRADWATMYHHRYLRHLATEYPLPPGYVRRSIRFWYFTNPDHNPIQGFKNWWVANRNHKRLTGLPA